MRKETQKLLVLSLLGFVSVNLAAQQKAKKDTVKGLDEVVVTALGIKRHDRGLGYVAEKVEAKTFEETQNNNWAQSMEGKVAGLKVQTAGAGPLGTSRITLRGEKSIMMDHNYALIVVDGVPLGNSTTGSGTAAYGAGSGGDVPIDLGNGLNSINPDDIESVTVLKGASAAALYGSRAANGALMITTKSGKTKNGKLRVAFNSSSSFDSVLKWPDYQYEYGQGTLATNAGNFYYSYGLSADGPSTGGTSSAFGPKFAGQYYFQYDPNVMGQSKERQLWRPYENNIKSFWQTGSTYSNSISVESSNEKTSFRSSLTYLNNEWMMPNTGFDRFNFALSFAHQLTQKLKISTKFAYNTTTSDNLPATGYNNQSISYFMIFQNPNVDLEWYKPIWKPGQEQVDQIHPFSSFIDNPYMIAYEMVNGVRKKTITGNITADYQFNKNFSLMLRSGIEILNEKRTTKRPWSSANYLKGFYREQFIKNQEYNNDLLFSYKADWNKFSVSASAGGSIRYNEYLMTDYQAIGLKTAGEYSLTNALNIPVKYPAPRDKHVDSVYGLLTLGYDNKIFVDVTGRNDWSSTLPKQNRSFFYPSVSTSFILSDIFNLKSNNLNLWKLRASWAKVGIDSDPYLLDNYYTGSNITGSVIAPTTFNNPSLKPEKNTNIEAGMDFSFFKNRLNLNLTAYQNVSENQIIPVSLPPESGYSKRIINAGKIRNRGLELSADILAVKGKDFSWKVGGNWSTNENRVMTLPEGFDGIVSNVGDVVFYKMEVGGSLGDMYGFKLLRTPDGKVIYGDNGLPGRPADIEKVGNAFPKWRAGLQNDFKIKNFTISFSFDGQYGGIAYSQSHHKMSEQGKLKSTLPGRDNPGGMIVGDGVVQNPDGSFTPNTKGVLVSSYYGDYYRRANVETNSFSTDFIKLRDARIAYSFPKETIKSIGLDDLTIAIFGKNLWMWTKFPLFDPEVATLDNATITPGVEMGQLPTARTVGFQLNLKF
ncbi:SusC/RagA family TonB-linked outer membrane protein [Chryseobacterium sp. JV558]|uniref:SusC/RagA family TonB-linked outer membrane protein n=1 Tax=Chryseobacterium sp. JV558 TaxID=2663236 RepID=UPI00299E052A|nr:SusC/RagA family TonB-linked outer membrane protein [Chryseobacterium sp. JV558]MDW9382610.1 SusC/RagA family TonB-linked outer membrane protein [Chryseobacterium sp. JV558]